MMKKRALIFLLAFAVILILGLIFKTFILQPEPDTSLPVQRASVNITVKANPTDLMVDSSTTRVLVKDSEFVTFSVK